MAGRVSPVRRKFLREESWFISPDHSAFQGKGVRRIYPSVGRAMQGHGWRPGGNAALVKMMAAQMQNGR
jgi:hypothetical protein